MLGRPEILFHFTSARQQWNLSCHERLIQLYIHGKRMKIEFGNIDELAALSPDVFWQQYVKKSIPVKVSKLFDSWPAIKNWDFNYFKNKAGTQRIQLKKFSSGGGVKVISCQLKDYVNDLECYDRDPNKKHRKLPPYCHDVPFFHLVTDLIDDVRPFATEFLPEWYRAEWWKYAQFFLGPAGSVTPLHFDTLRTHNLFFQIHGIKEFILLPPSAIEYCYRNSWRWFDVNPRNPDFETYPAYRLVKPMRVTVGPGDVLYMPPGMLHYVSTIEKSISFNIDFHTRRSVVNSFQFVLDGMPSKNILYNIIISLGLILKVPPHYLFSYYKSYLNYIS